VILCDEKKNKIRTVFDAQDRVYHNKGNIPLISLLGNNVNLILDVGCGAGNNAYLIKSKYKKCEIFGITNSHAEANIAKKYMKQCFLFDIESDFPPDLNKKLFDVLIFSHVLEHLKDPAGALEKFSRLLCKNGYILIAVPNILSWRMRLKFLLGKFEYESAGELDDTHLRFFTYFTADQYLLSKSPDLKLEYKAVSGNLPLWWLRKYFLPKKWSKYIDQWACYQWPNLFGSQVLIKALKQ
jgi:SAM-dependent methyltransferase